MAPITPDDFVDGYWHVAAHRGHYEAITLAKYVFRTMPSKELQPLMTSRRFCEWLTHPLVLAMLRATHSGSK